MSFSIRQLLARKPHINRIVLLLTLSDIFTWGIHMVILAIVGIYISMRLGENAIQIVGFGTAIFAATRGILQLPIGKLSDHLKFDNDEIIMLALGNMLMGASYLFYPFITTEILYYILQFVFAIGAAFNLVSWKKLFSENLDKSVEGMEYGQYGLLMGVATAIFSIAAGLIANLNMEYFTMLIVTIGILTMLSSVFAILIFTVKKRNSRLWQW